MFKDCKSGGYNLEKTQVNEQRLLAVVLIIAISYSLATFCGEFCQNPQVVEYIGRPKERGRTVARQSVFTLGLQVLCWLQSLEMCSDSLERLLSLKVGKRLHFQRAQNAIFLIQSTL
jgi:hypothetical protein